VSLSSSSMAGRIAHAAERSKNRFQCKKAPPGPGEARLRGNGALGWAQIKRD
jgi:hypothetical protein